MEPESRDETVEFLIYSNTHWWIVDKVKAQFNPTIAAEILKIVLDPNSNAISGPGQKKKMKALV